jgi:hypothetical protein
LNGKDMADSETESAYICFQSGKTKKNPSSGNIIDSDSSSSSDYEKDVGLRKSKRQEILPVVTNLPEVTVQELGKA